MKTTVTILAAILLVGCGESKVEIALRQKLNVADKKTAELTSQLEAAQEEFEKSKAEIKEIAESESRAREIATLLQGKLVTVEDQVEKYKTAFRQTAVAAAQLQQQASRAEAYKQWQEQNAKLAALQAQFESQRIENLSKQADLLNRQREANIRAHTELMDARARQKSADADVIRALRW